MSIDQVNLNGMSEYEVNEKWNLFLILFPSVSRLVQILIQSRLQKSLSSLYFHL